MEYIHKESNLPKEGWLHACVSCNEITSKTVFYKIKLIKGQKITYNAYLCPKCCQNRYKDKYEEYKFMKNCRLLLNT